jgi:hypothetical protein
MEEHEVQIATGVYRSLTPRSPGTIAVVDCVHDNRQAP